MLILISASALVILFLSLGIALLARQSLKREALEPTERANRYLYGGNSTSLATLSNLSAILSLSIVTGAVIPAASGWGWTPIYGLLMGLALGYGLLIRFVRRIQARHPKDHALPRTLVDFAPKAHRRTALRGIVGLYFILICMEFAVLRYFLEGLFGLSGLASVTVVLSCAFLCSAYTSLGGFLGVLRTDAAQLAIFAAGLVVLSIQFFDSAKETLSQSLSSEYTRISDPVLFFGALLITVLFQSSMPDQWLRNLGTLPANQERLLSLKVSMVGLMLAALPGSLIGLAALTDRGRLDPAANLERTFATLVGGIDHLVRSESGLLALWWVVGGAICLLITTLDSQILAVTQHLRTPRTEDSIPEMRLMHLLFAMMAALLSLGLSFQMWHALGVYTTLVLSANLAMLANAAYPVQQSEEAQSTPEIPYGLYYGVALFVTSGLILWKWGSLDQYLQHAALTQMALACLILFAGPRLWHLRTKLGARGQDG